ncbi:MAG: glycosyltransferase family 4 protein [Candidatus Acidiferrales bacterium]
MSRHMSAVIADLARRRNLDYKFLSLNDPVGLHNDDVGGLPFQYNGFHRAKSRFVLSALAAGARNPRLIFVAHVNLAPVGWLARQCGGGKMAVVGHGIEVWEPLPWIRRKAVKSANVLVAVSQFTGARFSDMQGIAPEAVRLLPLALDPSLRAAEENDLASLPPAWFRKGPVLLSVTRLSSSEAYKGVDTMIRTLARIQTDMPDLQYLIVGDGDDRPRLEGLAQGLGIAARVHFAGKLDASGLSACYANCDVFVLPSKGEGFGIVFLEAMAFGKPVIGGNHGGTPDIIEDGVTGYLVEHGNEVRLGQIVEMLVRDESLRKTIGRAAQSRVKSHYQFGDFRQRLETMLEECHLL